MTTIDYIKGFLGLLMLALLAAIAIGWGINIVKLFHHVGGFDMEAVLRIIGIFVAPLGAGMGLFI